MKRVRSSSTTFVSPREDPLAVTSLIHLELHNQHLCCEIPNEITDVLYIDEAA